MRVLLQASAASGLLLRLQQGQKCPAWVQNWCNEQNGNDIIGLSACVHGMAAQQDDGDEDQVECRQTECLDPSKSLCNGPSLAEVGAVQFDADGNKLTPAEQKVKRKTAVGPETPEGIQSLNMVHVHKNVVCSPDVPDWMQLTFNAMMSCSVPVAADTKALKVEGEAPPATPMCASYAEGGANDEFSHDFCRDLFSSMEEYKKCACTRWDDQLTARWSSMIATFPEEKRGMGEATGFDAQHYQDLVAMRRCPIVVQPRCLFGKMYRSECDALMANQDDTAGKDGLYEKMTVKAPADWKNDVPEQFQQKTVWDDQAASQYCAQ